MTQQTERTDGKSPALAGAEPSNSGASELDKLLTEFQGANAAPAVTSTVLSAVIPELKYLRERREAETQEAAEAAIAKTVGDAVAFMREPDDLKDAPVELVEGYLHARANKDAAFKTAFMERGEKPEAWKAALNGARDGYQAIMKGLSGGKLRTDIEAARASVAGQSSTAPPESAEKSNAELQAMNDHEFRAYKQKLLAGKGA